MRQTNLHSLDGHNLIKHESGTGRVSYDLLLKKEDETNLRRSNSFPESPHLLPSRCNPMLTARRSMMPRMGKNVSPPSYRLWVFNKMLAVSCTKQTKACKCGATRQRVVRDKPEESGQQQVCCCSETGRPTRLFGLERRSDGSAHCTLKEPAGPSDTPRQE